MRSFASSIDWVRRVYVRNVKPTFGPRKNIHPLNRAVLCMVASALCLSLMNLLAKEVGRRIPIAEIVLAYMEGCTDTVRLRHALSVAASYGKPVIMLKSGLTEVGKRAVAAHTGTDPGENYLYEDIFRSTGTLQACSIEEQVARPRPRSMTIAAL